MVDGVARRLSGTATTLGGIRPGASVEVYAVDEAGNRSLGALLAAGATGGSTAGGGSTTGGSTTGGGSTAAEGATRGRSGGSGSLAATGGRAALPLAALALLLAAVGARRLRRQEDGPGSGPAGR